MAATQDVDASEDPAVAEDVDQTEDSTTTEFLQVHEEPHKLIINLDPRHPVPWKEIIERTFPFMRCKEACVWDTRLNSPLPGAKVPSRPILDRTAEITNEPKTRINLLDLPTELTAMIFMEAAEPHALKAVTFLTWKSLGFLTKHLVFYAPRTWRDINLFQICRRSRDVAIRLYGNPSRDSLPFNPETDKISICGQLGVTPGLASDFGLVDLMESSRCLPFFLYEPRTAVSGVFYCNVPLYRATSATNFPRLTNSFTSRILVGEILVCEGSIYCHNNWGMVLHHLSRVLPLLQRLTVHTQELDSCSWTLEDLGPGERFYMARDMWLLESMRVPPKYEEVTGRLFPNLLSFTINHAGSVCARDMRGEGRTRNDYQGDHLFPGKEGDDWDISRAL